VDRQRYAQTDLWKLPAGIKARVAVIPVDERTRAILSAWDARKNGSSTAVLSAALADGWTRLSRRLSSLPAGALAAFENQELTRAEPGLTALRDELIKASLAGPDNPIARKGAGVEDLSLTLAIARSASTRAALARYVDDAVAAKAGSTAYARGSRALNLLIKVNLLARVDRDTALIASGASLETIAADPQHASLVKEARELLVYLNGFYDMRNFPEFPPGASFLGRDQYFAMGDNRGNSMDFRFSSASALRALDASDRASVLYPSAIAPFALERRYIESYALFRLWPLSRMGLIR
jgi:hypothetical protein